MANEAGNTMHTYLQSLDRYPALQHFCRVPAKRNPKSLTVSDLRSLGALFAPLLFGSFGLVLAYRFDSRFGWVGAPSQFPIELFIMALGSLVGTLGGVGDWIYHRRFVAVGPNERKSHLLALATGGVPLALLMCWASVSLQPLKLLIPILVVVLYTTTLICLDEFVFHWKRCLPLETMMHRMLVFGNCLAWLAWMHWCFVRGNIGG